MMTNLFSSFDPSTNALISLNWLSLPILIVALLGKYWFKSSNFMLVASKGMLLLFNEAKVIIPKSPYFSLILVGVFMMVAANNFMGLFPYIFTATSHMSVSLPLALPIWMGLMCFGWVKQNKEMFAHLVPQSTPGVLMPFMVIIESISNVIRPFTLAIRLSANMIAGHLLMTLLGNLLASSADSLFLPGIMITQLALSSLELAVSLIQAYVFFILLSLYLGEVDNH